MSRIYSKWANTYVAGLRARRKRDTPSWSDVADAYDAGLNHVVWLDHRTRLNFTRYMRALRVMNAAREESR